MRVTRRKILNKHEKQDSWHPHTPTFPLCTLIFLGTSRRSFREFKGTTEGCHHHYLSQPRD
uniref:Uncharacterized protein n=1 Tax=Lepeophtheirus salmonis TaxID=72036 RepID=A0A0K2VL59_LEPSM